MFLFPLVHQVGAPQKLLELSSQLPSRSLHRCWRVIGRSVTTLDLLARLSWDTRQGYPFVYRDRIYRAWPVWSPHMQEDPHVYIATRPPAWYTRSPPCLIEIRTCVLMPRVDRTNALDHSATCTPSVEIPGCLRRPINPISTVNQLYLTAIKFGKFTTF